MSADFSNFSDDFFVNMDLATVLTLPKERETVLNFFEAARKQFPDLAEFYLRDTGEFSLEGDRSSGSYRWVELDSRRLSSGTFNPAGTDAAYRQHLWLLERSRYFLGVSPLDVESLDLIYGFNLDYVGNRDAIVGEALLAGCRLAALADRPDTTLLSAEPSLIVALDSACSLQARLAVETHNSTYQVRTGQYDEEPISIYLTIRAQPKAGEAFDPLASIPRQAEAGEDLLSTIVIPKIIRPIASAIAAAQ